jgi:hypothetical protein
MFCATEKIAMLNFRCHDFIVRSEINRECLAFVLIDLSSGPFPRPVPETANAAPKLEITLRHGIRKVLAVYSNSRDRCEGTTASWDCEN